MKDTKFRGIYKGNFVYGNLIIGVGLDGEKLCQIENTDPHEFRKWDVDPETVGQLTGLSDKNGTGKEVYESDLFEVVYSNVPNGFEAMNFKKELKINIGEVVFKFGSFQIKTLHPDHKEYVYMNLHTFLKNDEKVVIGNVFQNRELIES